MSETRETDPATRRRHLRFGWWALLVFLTLGATLEAMHGFKVGWYLDVGNETRRLLLRLAHAHGALLAALNILFGLSLPHLQLAGRRRALVSRLLLTASILLPLGFLSGGLVVWGGDPWLGVLLVPVAAAALFAAVFLTAKSVE